MKRKIILSMLSVLLLVGLHIPILAVAVEVFVTIPPQKWVSDRLGGEYVTTRVLVKNGQDPHTFEPTPKQVAALTKARVYFTLGMEFEEQIIGKVRQAASGLHVVATTDQIRKIDMAGHGHENTHGHDELDPHVWLSPPNLKSIATQMAESLIAVDPANRDEYRKNLGLLHEELDLLHEDISRELAPFRGASFYVFHPSFGYFAKTYGLRQEAVEIEGKSPTPKQLSALIAKAKAEHVKVIFVQPQFDPKSGRVVARAIGGEVVALDALAEDVVTNLKIMAQKIQAALIAK